MQNNKPITLATLEAIAESGIEQTIVFPDGQVTVDMLTANMLLNVYNNLNGEHQDQFRERLSRNAKTLSVMAGKSWNFVRMK